MLSQHRHQPPELKLGPAPTSRDLKASAEYFMSMLDALGQSQSRELIRIRGAFIDIISEYQESAQDDEAKAMTAAKMAGAEAGIVAILANQVERVHKQLERYAKQLRGRQKVSEISSLAADTFALLADGIRMYQHGCENHDAARRDEGLRIIDKAQQILTRVGDVC